MCVFVCECYGRGVVIKMKEKYYNPRMFLRNTFYFPLLILNYTNRIVSSQGIADGEKVQ